MEEVDSQVDDLADGLLDWAQKAVGTTCAVLATLGAAPEVQAFPIYAQQNYKNPIDATGRLACANCHLGSKKAHLRAPFSVYPDTVFRTLIDIPADYEYKKQLLGTGERGDMQVGAVIVMPKGFKLAPKDRLPKILKKQMKGLAWSAYSKEKPNIIVAGPATNKYNVMVAPILSPDPAAEKKPGDVGSLGAGWGRCEFNLGANRGRGQVYPDGTKSNVNMFASPATGTITAIEDVPPKEGEKQVARPAKKVTITKEDGNTASDTVGAGATWVVSLGDKVKKDQPLTTNPNLGGFGQSDKDVVLQDPRREQVYTATAFTLFLTQLSFVLKKKQFEKVQLAEGF